MDFRTAFDALKRLTNYETMARPPYGTREMNLPRTRALLAKLGRPELRYPSLQVAGTKGKGTTATSLAAMLSCSGRRVGLYTSPHLFHVRERIQVDGRWISEDEFGDVVKRVLRHVAPLAGTIRCPTFFEILTCAALLHFAESDVDAAVLEVGLGGRLDATSAVRPLLSIVTQIGHDHMALLGRTLPRIAREKAGVAKSGVPLLSGVPRRSPAGAAIAEVAAEKGAEVLFPGRDFALRTGAPVVRRGETSTPVTVRIGVEVFRASPSVFGRELARDAGLAAAALLTPTVRSVLPPDLAGMRRGLQTMRVPGRIQVVSRRPLLVVDGAHNPESIRSLARVLTESLSFTSAVLVMGGATDKRLTSLARDLRTIRPDTRVVFTRPREHPRAADPADLARVLPPAEAAPTLGEALERARDLCPQDGLVVVTGSLYLAGEALEILGAAPVRPWGPRDR